MNLKVEQYLVLSSLAYQVIPNSLLDDASKQTLEEIVSHLTARTDLLELKSPLLMVLHKLNNFQKRNNLEVLY
jgi:hypothetical protein